MVKFGPTKNNTLQETCKKRGGMSGQSYTSVEMIEKLVSFDTVSSRSNMELIDFVRDYLSGHGVESHLVKNEDGDKANLYATVGPNIVGGVVLSGHTDVVPIDGQPWDSDPFQIVEKNDRLYGRGTSDMKSFSAIALAKVPDMLKKGIKSPIHFALSYDEEIGCNGAPHMIREIAKNVPRPRAVIVGEPSNMETIVAHKGLNGFKTTVRGHEAHSSLVHKGVSAVMTAAHLIDFIHSMMNENKEDAHPDSPFDPPYSTLHIGTIQGGTAVNIISRHCEFAWDIRNIPEDDPQKFIRRLEAYCEENILPGMKAVSQDCRIVTEEVFSAPSLHPEKDGEAEHLCKTLTGKNSTNVVSYGTEAGQFQEENFSVVICGPGSIEQAHQPNEFIELSQVREGAQFADRLIDRLAQ